jgi:hypothetical protein
MRITSVKAGMALACLFLLFACSKEKPVEPAKILSIDDYLKDKTLRDSVLTQCAAMKGDSQKDANCTNAYAARVKQAQLEMAKPPNLQGAKLPTEIKR